jgi:hypothetical protein
MATSTRQTFANHRRTVPLFHLGVTLGLLINQIWTTRELISQPNAEHAVGFVLALTLVLMFWFIRRFPIQVQDRLIRLEMRIRLRDALPPALQPRIGEFSMRQLIAMRFASDEELPTLAAQVLDKKIEDGTTIKKLIQNWQADHARI